VSKSVFDFARVKQLAQIVESAPKMQLKVLSSGKLKGHVVKINAQGMESSLRTQKDGFVYFGCKKHGNK
jgi:hypothetical protein